MRCKPLDDDDVITIGRTILVFRWPAVCGAELAEFTTYAELARTTTPMPVTYSPLWYAALWHLKHAAAANTPIDLAAEFGTEVCAVAHALHACSGRPGAFVAVDPYDLREDRLLSLLCSARQGTLFLDELAAPNALGVKGFHELVRFYRHESAASLDVHSSRLRTAASPVMAHSTP